MSDEFEDDYEESKYLKWPEELKVQMPLPDGYVWEDETDNYHPGLIKPTSPTERNPVGWYTRRTGRVKIKFIEQEVPVKDAEEAMRLIYAKFLFQ